MSDDGDPAWDWLTWRDVIAFYVVLIGLAVLTAWAVARRRRREQDRDR